jgi:hypothetical protein
MTVPALIGALPRSVLRRVSAISHATGRALQHPDKAPPPIRSVPANSSSPRRPIFRLPL